jgi:hypothetical protein
VVPLSVPLRRVDWNGVTREPASHPSLRQMHRLREMRACVSIGSAGGSAGTNSIGGVSGVHGVCIRLPC